MRKKDKRCRKRRTRASHAHTMQEYIDHPTHSVLKTFRRLALPQAWKAGDVSPPERSVASRVATVLSDETNLQYSAVVHHAHTVSGHV